MNTILQPMLASLADAPLNDPHFVYEPKYDGIRAIAEIGPKGSVRLWSRLGNEKTRQFPEIATALARWASKRKETLVLAGLYRTALAHLGVRGYPKTTGKRGIQIWIPIEPRYSFSETSNWVERISRAIGSTVPDLVSWDWAKANRGGKARLDYTQNQPIKTLVAPYAVRPSTGRDRRTPPSTPSPDDPAHDTGAGAGARTPRS